jgi:tetratricopeptide (TPR) repeat protein
MLLDEAGRDREAAQVLDQAVEHSAAVVAAAPMDPEHAKQLGVSLTNRAQAAINLHELDVAEELLGRAISTLEESKKREPRDRLMQRYLRNAYRARGNVLDMQDRITEAEADWERVIELSEGLGDYETVAEQVSSRADRRTSAAIITAIDKARSGEPHLALQALRTILDRTNASSVSTRYNLACALSVCAGAILDDKTRDKSETTSRAEELSAQAVDLLRQAHSSGFFDRPDARELLRGDHDLDALRGRRDFQLFLLEVDFPVEPFARAG